MESFINRERYPSGQRGQTVNLLAHAFGGSNPPLSRERHDTAKVFFCGSNSVARVTAFQAVGRGFESRLPLLLKKKATTRTKPERRKYGEREV